MDSKKKVILQVLNLVTLIITVIINYTATLFGLGGYSTGELSDSIPNLFVPAGITFTIWAVIYLFLGIFVVYQAPANLITIRLFSYEYPLQ